MASPLKLRLESDEDIPVISALLQDSVMTSSDLYWSPIERRFAFVCNRFKWEQKKRWFRRPRGERVRTALHLNGVTHAALKDINLRAVDQTLSLLSVTAEKDGNGYQISFTFSGAPAIRLQAECIDGVLTDLTDSWDALGRPSHD